MVRPVRFELTTPCFGGTYSIHLSYGRTVLNYNLITNCARVRRESSTPAATAES
jgi:hypothetical protein